MTEGNFAQNQPCLITPDSPPPADYPFESFSDEFIVHPFADEYQARRRAFLEFIGNNPSPTDIIAIYFEIARIFIARTPHEGLITATINYINDRKDCSDSAVHGILRLLYQFGGNNYLSLETMDQAKNCILNFKYWPDEPGQDSMCLWTENHYIQFSTAGYLAGQLYPNQLFTNSDKVGIELMQNHRQRIINWLNLRFYTGFSEWLSNVYYDEDLTALISLVDFCQDEEIRTRASMIIDLILFDIAINNFKGVFGSTHGRSYEEDIKWANKEKTSNISKLLFGCGAFNHKGMGAIALALSPSYKAPRVIYEISNDLGKPELLSRSRMGIRMDQIEWWGLKPNNVENGMLLLNMEAYLHPKTVNIFIKMMNQFGWWENDLFQSIKARRGLIRILRGFGLLSTFTRIYKRDISRNTRVEANIYTYRTPDYMLSTAQDYRKGYGGDQQHIWQATLGPNSVCFTTHPARKQGPSPNYWTGSGSLPRVAQIKNVLIAIYRISTKPAIYVPNKLLFTHAWLPKDQFDEIIEDEGWIFARLGNGYLGLLSQHPYEWRTLPGVDKDREVIVKAKNNIWLCELGRREIDGDFEVFINKLLEASVLFRGSRVKYNSPSQGSLQFDWSGPLLQNGTPISLDDYPRYGNPYAQADFPLEQLSISTSSHSLHLDWNNLTRYSTEYI